MPVRSGQKRCFKAVHAACAHVQVRSEAASLLCCRSSICWPLMLLRSLPQPAALLSMLLKEAPADGTAWPEKDISGNGTCALVDGFTRHDSVHGGSQPTSNTSLPSTPFFSTLRMGWLAAHRVSSYCPSSTSVPSGSIKKSCFMSTSE